jgi:hypothetical protein
MQPSASRTTKRSALYPSSKLLGYYHSSALRTDKPTFCAKPCHPLRGLRLVTASLSTSYASPGLTAPASVCATCVPAKCLVAKNGRVSHFPTCSPCLDLTASASLAFANTEAR